MDVSADATMFLSETTSETDASTIATSEESRKVIPPDEYAMQLFCKKVLKSRIFLGNYIERRLVSESIGYRDVVSISEAERELKRDLQLVRKTLKEFHPSGFWVGITNSVIPGTPLGECLWVELSNVPFGVHWFQIKTVRFRKSEVLLKLQCLRSLHDKKTELPPQNTSKVDNQTVRGEINNIQQISFNDNIEAISNFLQQTKQDILKYSTELLTLLTISNAFAVVKFLIVTAIALVTGSFYIVGNLGDFSLRLFRETSLFVHSATPIVLGFMEFCSKLVGGFYILIAMIFRDKNPSGFNPQIDYSHKRNSRRSIMYDREQPAGNVTLTEID